MPGRPSRRTSIPSQGTSPLSEIAETDRRWRPAARIFAVVSAAKQKRLAGQNHVGGTSRQYWREIGKRAWKRALGQAWGSTLAGPEATVVPVLIVIFVGLVAGSATRNALVGAGAGLTMAVGRTAFFFAINLINLPARIHADLAAKLNSAREAIRTYNSTVDRSMVRNLLLRMREKCLAYRNNQVTVADQVRWAGELLESLSTLYGPEAATALRRELPYLLAPRRKSTNDGLLHAAFGRQAFDAHREGGAGRLFRAQGRSQQVCSTAADGSPGRATARQRGVQEQSCRPCLTACRRSTSSGKFDGARCTHAPGGGLHSTEVVVACSPIALILAGSPSGVLWGTLKTWPGQMRSGSLIFSSLAR